MLGYAIATLRARRGAFFGAFLALMCAAALVTACGSLLETGLRGEIRTERYAAAPLVVAADQNVHHTEQRGDKTKHKVKPLYERVWLPAGTAERVAAVPGVEAVVPELTFPAEIMTGTPAGDDEPPSYGHGWGSAALTPFTITDGRAPGADDEIAVDAALADRAGLSVGDRVVVQATAAPATYLLTGVVTGDIAEQRAVFFTDGEARRLAGHDGQDAVLGVFPAAGTSPDELAGAVREALDGTTARVHTGGDRGPVEFLDAAQARVELISMGGALGGTGLIVSVLVVVGTFGLVARARHRELALLRAVAATPRQVRRLIGREALLLGLTAGLAGAVAGLPLGAWVYGRFTDLGTIPETLGQVRGVFPMAAAVLTTTLAAWLAARVASRRPARIRPAEARAPESRRPGWGRLVAGLVVLAGGVVLLAVLSALRTEPASTPVTYLTVLLLCVAVSLLGGHLARVVFAVAGVLLRAVAPVAGHLAAHHARANARRLATVVTPLTMLVSMASVIVFAQTTLGNAAERQAREGVVAGQVVTATTGPGVPGAAAERLRAVPSVTGVTELVRSMVRTPGLDKYTAQGVTAGPGLAETLDLGVTEGTLDDLDADGLAVSDLVADHHGLAPGDPMDLVLGDGTPVTLTVVAVYDRALGFGDLTMAHQLLAAHVDNPLAEAVLVAGDATPDTLTAALDGFPALAVRDGGAVADAVAAGRETNAEVAFLGMGLILAFTTIAAVNSLAMATADRAREFALLGRIGTTRRQLRGMLRLESLTVAGTAVALGTVIALATLTAFSAGMTGTAAPALAAGPYLLIAGGATVLAWVATAVPARVAMARAR
jgi:putative ABC transport system permease protein